MQDILSKIPFESIDTRSHIVLNGLSHSYDQTMLRYRTLEKMLLENPQNPDNTNAIGLAWDVVDWINRYRIILNKGTGLKKKEEWYKHIMDVLKDITPIRNFIQHYDQEINRLIDTEFPALGSLSFLIPAEGGFNVTMIAPGNHRVSSNEMIIGGFKAPESVKAPIDHITLILKDMSVNLTQIIRQLISHENDLKKYLISKYEL